MNELNPCLLGCYNALAEADSLIAMLSGQPAALEPEITALRIRIARLRDEVDRLRGMPGVPSRRQRVPEWVGSTDGRSPWTPTHGESPIDH